MCVSRGGGGGGSGWRVIVAPEMIGRGSLCKPTHASHLFLHIAPIFYFDALRKQTRQTSRPFHLRPKPLFWHTRCLGWKEEEEGRGCVKNGFPLPLSPAPMSLPLFLDLGLMTSQQLEVSRTFLVLLLQTSPQKRGERRTNCRLYFGGEPCLFPVINAIYMNHPGRERAWAIAAPIQTVD